MKGDDDYVYMRYSQTDHLKQREVVTFGAPVVVVVWCGAELTSPKHGRRVKAKPCAACLEKWGEDRRDKAERRATQVPY